MTKTEHLQFLVLLIPTFMILVAAAVSMADLGFPEPSYEMYVVNAYTAAAEDLVRIRGVPRGGQDE